jgi:hypothetical protein
LDPSEASPQSKQHGAKLIVVNLPASHLAQRTHTHTQSKAYEKQLYLNQQNMFGAEKERKGIDDSISDMLLTILIRESDV